jgi:hypothetical protein
MVPDLFGMLKGYAGLLGELKELSAQRKKQAKATLRAGTTQVHGYALALARQHPDAFGPYLVLLVVASGCLLAQIVSFDGSTGQLILGEPVVIRAVTVPDASERAGGFYAKVAKACVKRVEHMHSTLTPGEKLRARLQGPIRQDLCRQAVSCKGEIVTKEIKFSSVGDAEAFRELVRLLRWDRSKDEAPSLPRFVGDMDIERRKTADGEEVFGRVRMLMAGSPEEPTPNGLKGEIYWAVRALRDLHRLGWSYDDMRQRNIVLGLFLSILVDLDGGHRLRGLPDDWARWHKERDYRDVVQHLAVPYIRDFKAGGALAKATDLAEVILALNTRPVEELESPLLGEIESLRPSMDKLLKLRAFVLEKVTAAACVDKLVLLGGDKRVSLVVVGSGQMAKAVRSALGAEVMNVRVVTAMDERGLVTDASLDLIVIAAPLSYPQFIHTAGRLVDPRRAGAKPTCAVLVRPGDAEQARYLVGELAACGGALPRGLAKIAKADPLAGGSDG